MSAKLFTVNQVAERLKVTRATVYSLMKSGKLPYTLVGQRRRIEEAVIEEYIQRNRREGTDDSDTGRASPCVASA